MNKIIYCIWNEHTGAVVLKFAVWDDVKHISRTGVEKFGASHRDKAVEFATAKKKELENPELPDPNISESFPYYIGIVGSRERDTEDDYKIVEEIVLNYFEKRGRGLIMVSGGCYKGADNFAERIKDKFGIPILIFPPDKQRLASLDTGNSKQEYAIVAYERNTEIAKKSDILLALVSESGKGGTMDTIKKFKKFRSYAECIIR